MDQTNWKENLGEEGLTCRKWIWTSATELLYIARLVRCDERSRSRSSEVCRCAWSAHTKKCDWHREFSWVSASGLSSRIHCGLFATQVSCSVEEVEVYLPMEWNGPQFKVLAVFRKGPSSAVKSGYACITLGTSQMINGTLFVMNCLQFVWSWEIFFSFFEPFPLITRESAIPSIPSHGPGTLTLTLGFWLALVPGTLFECTSSRSCQYVLHLCIQSVVKFFARQDVARLFCSWDLTPYEEATLSTRIG